MNEKQSHNIGDLMGDIDESVLMLKRSVASYNALAGGLRSKMDPSAPPKGLPVLLFHATSTGRDRVECCVDLNDIDPKYLTAVLAPIIHSEGRAAQAAVDRVRETLDVVSQMLQAALKEAPPQTKKARARPEPVEDEDFCA